MQNLFRLMFGLVLSMGSSIVARSQGDPCGCNVAIEGHLQDELTMLHDQKIDEVDSVIFSKNFEYWDQEQWKNDQSMQSGGQAYASMFSGFLDLSQSKDQQKLQFESLQTRYRHDHHLQASDYLFLSQKTTSSVAYNKWAECKAGCSDISRIVIKKNAQIGGEVTITLTVIDPHNPAKVKLFQIHRRNVSAESHSVLHEGMNLELGRPYTTTFRVKDPAKDGIIDLNIGTFQSEEIVVPSKQDLITEAPVSRQKISIANGTLQENSILDVSWGIRDEDKGAATTNQYLPLPLNTYHYHEAAWSGLSAASALNFQNDKLQLGTSAK